MTLDQGIESTLRSGNVPWAIGNWSLFLCFVAIGLLQTLLAYEAGALAVKALPTEIANSATRKRYLRFFFAAGVALFLLTVTIGWLNDRTQRSSDAIAQETNQSVHALREDVKSQASEIKSEASALLNANIFRELPEDAQRSVLQINRHAEDLVSLTSAQDVRKLGPVDQQNDAPSSNRPTARQQGIPIPNTSTSSALPESAGKDVGPPDSIATTHETSSPEAPTSPAAPFLQLETLKVSRANQQYQWDFIAWLNDRDICDLSNVVTANNGGTVDLRKVCKPYSLPEQGRWLLRAQVDGQGGIARLLNCQGIIVADALDISQKEGTMSCISSGDSDFTLVFSIHRK